MSIDSLAEEKIQIRIATWKPSTNFPVNATPLEGQQRINTPDWKDEQCFDVDVNVAGYDSHATNLDNQFDNAEDDDSYPMVDRIITHSQSEGVLEVDVHFSDDITS